MPPQNTTLETTMNKLNHPIQPLEVDEHGVVRFKQNAIVRYLLDQGGIDLNQISGTPFSRQDRVQFAQLIGYSMGGFGDLSYVTQEDYEAAYKSFPGNESCLEWTEDFDDGDNSIWEAMSPYHDDGSFFKWRLCQRLEDNRIIWYSNHDKELGGTGDYWVTLQEAKDATQNSHDHILEHESSEP